MAVALDIAPVPRPGDPPTPLTEAHVAMWRRWHLDMFGHDDLWEGARSLAAAYADQDYYRKTMVNAVDGGQVVGASYLRLPLKDNTDTAEFDFGLDPDAGVGPVADALWDQARAQTEEAGRHTVHTWTVHRLPPDPVDDEVEWITPRTGRGRLAVEDLVRTLTRWGFTLEQVERHNQLVVAEALEGVDELEQRARAHAQGYETFGWVGPTPPDLRDGMAVLCGRMSIDAPSGELDIDEEQWDADRVAHADEMVTRTGGVKVTTVARHVETGALAAYTEFVCPTDHPAVGYQDATLVHGEHRGHRLGMLVKTQNLRRLHEHLPQVARIHTWNADENEHMLAINAALGFRVVSLGGGWQLKL